MPDVEVKLNIEAEYKQALAAIAEMGKALEAVQVKAKALQEATKNVATVSGADGGQAEALNATVKLNEASKQLAGHLAQVAVASMKAKEQLQAMAGIQPYTEESLGLINKAVAGYEQLATMATMAANAAERFRKVGSDGLTTEEMIRQTQAAEKQLETLKAQSVELERSIAAQREQLNVLRETTAELKKQAQAKSAEEKERERSIAIREREAKAEEEADFKLKLAGKSRLELSKIYKELAQNAKKASEAQDYESAAKYERQMQLVNLTLRKVNTSARIANIALMQQAQAAQRIGQNLETLTKGFTGLGEALEKGELNLTGMGSAFISLMRDFKAGLGPIGWVMLALQGLQALWNSYAKSRQEAEKRRAESEKATLEILNTEKTLYEELKVSRAEYESQVALSVALKELNTGYESVKNNIKDSIALIEQATQAELVRLSVVKTKEEYQRIKERYELGRAYRRGDLTEEEYNKRILALDTAEQISEAEEKAEKKKAQRKEKVEKADVLYKEYDTASEAFYNALGKKKKQFGKDFVSDSEINKYEKAVAEQNRLADSYSERARDVLKERGFDEVIIDQILKAGYIPETITSKKGVTVKTRKNNGDFWDSDFYEVEALLNQRRAASESGQRLTGELTGLLGGMSVQDYKKARDTIQQEIEFWEQKKEEALEAFKEARNAYEALPADYQVEHALKEDIKRINLIAGEKRADIEADAVEATKAQQRAQQLEAAKRTAGSLTEREISEQLRYLTPGLSSANTKERAYSEQMSAVYRAELTRRQGAFSQAKKGLLSDGKIDVNDIPAIKDLIDAARDGTAADKELYKAVMSFVRSQLKRNKDSKAFSKKLNEELAR